MVFHGPETRPTRATRPRTVQQRRFVKNGAEAQNNRVARAVGQGVRLR